MTRSFALFRALACWVGVVAMLVVVLPGRPALAADESPVTTAEIAHLLGHIRTSNCEFLRNGAWHSSEAAHDHITKKLKYIRYRNTLRDAEQFIEMAATRSSMSGEIYRVRCPGVPLEDCSRWLLDELGRFRRGIAPQR